MTDVQEYAQFGERAGRELAREQVEAGWTFPQTSAAVTARATANVLGASHDERGRAYVAAFDAGYFAVWGDRVR